MPNQICKYSKDAVCTKHGCPLHGSTCVCNIIGKYGVCKYEELVDDVKTYTPVECLKKAFSENHYHIDNISDYDANNAINRFLDLMQESGHLDFTKTKGLADFHEGDELRIIDVSGNPNWKETNSGRDWIVYQTIDNKLEVVFHDSETTAIVHCTC